MNILEHTDYQELLNALMQQHPKGGHGGQTRLAKKIGCQQAYLSRVVAMKAHLSSDQIIKVSEYFLLDEYETDYFMFLNLFNRCSDARIKAFYKSKLNEITLKKLNISARIKPFEKLNEKDIAIYYSDWSYQAVHAATAVSQYQTIPQLAEKLSINDKKIKKILDFLVRAQVVEEKNHVYRNSKAFLHLPADSDFIQQHHRNWRLKSIEALKNAENNLHYTSTITCSESDAQKIKETMLTTIKSIRKVVKDSQDENVFCYNLDFFTVN